MISLGLFFEYNSEIRQVSDPARLRKDHLWTDTNYYEEIIIMGSQQKTRIAYRAVLMYNLNHLSICIKKNYGNLLFIKGC